VSLSIKQVLCEAREQGWMGAVRGIMSAASSMPTSECALILKGDGTRGNIGVVFHIPAAEQYLDFATGAPLKTAWLDQLAQPVLQRMREGRAARPLPHEYTASSSVTG